MSEFNELIKSFGKSRNYVRDFFVYGFKSREDFSHKSARTYDNERRRIESWLSEYIQSDYTKSVKKISLAIDSNQLDTNPLYRVWKSKSFTANDIMLHFFILDILNDNEDINAESVTDLIGEKAEVVFDTQLVRKKLNEYSKEGIILKKKIGKEIVYRINNIEEIESSMMDAISLYQLWAPLGIVGSTLLDRYSVKNNIFRVKHGFFVHTLEDEVLTDILLAMKEEKEIEIENRSTGGNRTWYKKSIPLKIMVSTRTGRRYVCTYNSRTRRYMCIRLDYIQSISLGDKVENYADMRARAENNFAKAWGVSFGENRKREPDYIKLVLYVNEETEQYILHRLETEMRGGSITRLGDNTYCYEVELFDGTEMMPWIRSFIGRIISIESNNEHIERTLNNDLQYMYQMYDLDDESLDKT